MTPLFRGCLTLCLASAVLLACPPNRPVCGNGKLEALEQCDDGNQTAGDGCENNCTPSGGANCGNAVTDEGEACDDGNQTPGDGCENDCTLTGAARCGDGRVNSSAEQCDDGNQTAADGCENDCTFTPGARCGNGIKEGDEVCDDGNLTAGDGCENDCTKSPLGPVCGDGMRQGAESCDDGNQTAGDGCENDCTLTGGSTVSCPGATLPAPAAGTCDITTGDNNRLFTGVVLAPDQVYLGGQVLVNAQGSITCVGCDCSTASGASGATKITCPKGVISPGLINAHDHISYQASPYSAASANADPTERYEHRHDWRIGGTSHDNHTRISNGGTANNNQIRWAELRQLMSGTTSVVGATYSGTGNQGFLRNLDTGNTGQEGLGEGASGVNSETFPLSDQTTGIELTQGCAYPESGIDKPTVIRADSAYLPHVSEGIETSAQNEFRCISGQAVDLLGPRTSIVHGIALKAADVGLLANKGSSLVWSPRSNVSLYGDTAQVPVYVRLGVNVALGTDWVRSGSMNMLRELKCADELNTQRWNRALSDETLWRIATQGGADATQTAEKIGRLQIGKVADLAIYRQQGGSTHRSVIEAQPQDVVLVMRGGKALFGDQSLVNALASNCDTIDVCSTMKAACVSGELAGTTYAALQTANATTYPLFQCGTPANEPSCVPERAARNVKNGSSTYVAPLGGNDPDGDGITTNDNCPNVFNPIRPMDNGKQADADNDGIGDVCDLCPLNAGTACMAFNPNDSDGDGIANATDNCPADPNPLQTDTDSDGKGDVCDSCAAPNPGQQGCPVTIYDLKRSTTYLGQNVSLANVLVTGVAATGFFVQVHPNESIFTSADYSGLFIYKPGHGLSVGDRVTITDGVASNYFGQIQMANPTLATFADGGVQVLSSNNAPPPPVQVTAADVAKDGGRSLPLESVVVQLGAVTVTQVNLPAGPGDMAPTNEYQVNGVLPVNDLLYLTAPFPSVGQALNGITGVLDYRNNAFKLNPRSASDVAAGPAIVAALEPALVFVREGQSTTLPTPLTVRLSNTEATNVAVTVVAGTGQVGVMSPVTVPAGQLSAEVALTGITATAGSTVTITASRNASMATAQVRVIGATEVPALVSLTPMSGSAAPGGTVRFTVGLDIPAAAPTTINLAVTPGGFATVPSTVSIAADQTQASFDVTFDAAAGADGGVAGTLSASLGAAAPLTANLTVATTNTSHLVISEVGPKGPAGAGDEFIELYNPTSQAIDIGGWKVQYKSASGTQYISEWVVPVGNASVNTVVPPRGYFLIAGAGYMGPTPDLAIATALNLAGDSGHVRIGTASLSKAKVDPNAVDTLGYGPAADSAEGGVKTPALTSGNNAFSFERKANPGSTAASMAPGGLDVLKGNGLDTDKNGDDFVVRTTREPQNMGSAVEP